MTRLSAIAPAIAMLLPCAGWATIIGLTHSAYAAGITVAAFGFFAAVMIAFGPLVTGLSRAKASRDRS